MKSATTAIWKSTGLHLALGGMLFASMEFHTPIEAQEVLNVNPIQAVVVDAQEVQKIFDKIEQEKRAVEQEKLRQREDQQRKAQQAEEAKKKKIARDKARKEKERKEAERKKKEKEEKARKEKERKEKERKDKERKEKERKEREENERLEQERVMREQLEAERAAVQASRRSKEILSEKQKYIGLIISTVQQKWIIDDTMRGKECRLNIQLASNGLVLRVNILGGDPVVCRTSRAAVLKAETLPVSSDPEVFKEFRNFNLTMSPEVK